MGLRSRRKVNGEDGTGGWVAGDIDFPFVRLNNRSDKAQTQPRPAFRAASIPAVETVPHFRKISRRNSYPGVAHGDNDSMLISVCLHVNFSPGGRIFEGIVKQIG